MNQKNKKLPLTVESKLIARKLLCAVLGFGEKLDNKKDLTAAEKRHQLKIKTLKSLDANN